MNYIKKVSINIMRKNLEEKEIIRICKYVCHLKYIGVVKNVGFKPTYKGFVGNGKYAMSASRSFTLYFSKKLSGWGIFRCIYKKDNFEEIEKYVKWMTTNYERNKKYTFIFIIETKFQESLNKIINNIDEKYKDYILFFNHKTFQEYILTCF